MLVHANVCVELENAKALDKVLLPIDRRAFSRQSDFRFL